MRFLNIYKCAHKTLLQIQSQINITIDNPFLDQVTYHIIGVNDTETEFREPGRFYTVINISILDFSIFIIAHKRTFLQIQSHLFITYTNA